MTYVSDIFSSSLNANRKLKYFSIEVITFFAEQSGMPITTATVRANESRAEFARAMPNATEHGRSESYSAEVETRSVEVIGWPLSEHSEERTFSSPTEGWASHRCPSAVPPKS